MTRSFILAVLSTFFLLGVSGSLPAFQKNCCSYNTDLSEENQEGQNQEENESCSDEDIFISYFHLVKLPCEENINPGFLLPKKNLSLYHKTISQPPEASLIFYQ